MKVARLTEEAFLPTRKHHTDAGIDFYALGDHLIRKNSYTIIKTGITVEIPKGYMGLLKPKGGSNHLIGAGVVDENYQGEILVKVFNPTEEPILIRRGKAFVQMVIIPVVLPQITLENLDDIHKEKSTRGDTGGIVTQTSKAEVIENPDEFIEEMFSDK